MPHQTFFNLPQEKRQQILQVAIDEFAENDYDNVSISRIVARAGIAKGSFYQYFADKEDLYGHVLSLLAKAKTDFMSLDHPDPHHIGIFAYLRWMAEVGVAFQMAYPQFSKIAVRAANVNFFPRPFNANVREQTIAFYRRLVEVGQAQGDIDPAIDPAVAAVIFDGALTSIGNYMLDKFATGEIPLKLEGDDMFNMPEITKLFTAAVDLLEYGMRKQGPSQVTGQVQSAEEILATAAGVKGD
jgi:TetR/AcrR family transcriptional regulator